MNFLLLLEGEMIISQLSSLMLTNKRIIQYYKDGEQVDYKFIGLGQINGLALDKSAERIWLYIAIAGFAISGYFYYKYLEIDYMMIGLICASLFFVYKYHLSRLTNLKIFSNGLLVISENVKYNNLSTIMKFNEDISRTILF